MATTTGQRIVNKSGFGQIDPQCETLDGRNIGEMQQRLTASLDELLTRFPSIADKIPTQLDVMASAGRVVSQMIKKQWGGTGIEVWVERNGKKAILGVYYQDIVEMMQITMGDMWTNSKRQ